jgi:adenylosuccinate synthase
MANIIVVGGQWGDEGKGKVVDLLCPAFTHIVRFNGGNNAGHTVRFADRHYALHLVPSGILHQDCRCFLGSQVVIDPLGLTEEIRNLEENGVSVRPRLVISSRAHIVLPGHRALDVARDAARGAGRIGTTGKGIGPTYESRAARTGVRIGLARDPRRLREAIVAASAELEHRLAGHESAVIPAQNDIERMIEATLALAPLVADITHELGSLDPKQSAILFEGAQGTLLDLDYGTYPYVTSSSCLAGFAAPACGLPARVLNGVLGVFKAYVTRVGGGPFPTEISEGVGEHLRQRGNEFGTTTGRPRRTGWFDAVAGRAAMRWNGVDAIALTKLDVLDEVAEIKIATAYTLRGQQITDLPEDAEDVAALEPVYEVVRGWQSSTSGVTSLDKLPKLAQTYVRRLEHLLGAPAVMVSTGPRREETIVRHIAPLRKWIPSLG